MESQEDIVNTNGLTISKLQQIPVVISEPSIDHKVVTPTVDNTAILDELRHINENISKLRTDVDKLKTQMLDKVPKSVLVELDSKILNHTKILDSNTSKLYELQKNVKEFVNQPVTHTIVDTLRKQLTEDVLTTVKKMLEVSADDIKGLIDIKINEVRGAINSAKRVLFYK